VYRTEIVYDRQTRDYAMYLDRELVGYARTYADAEATLDALISDLMGQGLASVTSLLNREERGHEEDKAPPGALSDLQCPVAGHCSTMGICALGGGG
jgi:hypothetical protein